jgi:three-Cys-motif partner protein
LTKGHPGSPVVAIRTAVQGVKSLNVPLHVKMVESNPERCQYLSTIIQRESEQFSDLSEQIKIDAPVLGECEQIVTALLDEHTQKDQPLGPAFFFLDQYGYSGFSMDLVRRILAHEKCETFAYLNWQRMHPYFTDPTKADAFTRALGGDEWRGVQSLRDQERVDGFKSIYMHSLRERAGAKYVYDFAMRGPDHRLIYWLFFCTNRIEGLEVMKKAMWKVDPTGRFEFSDQDANQTILYPYTQSTLADDLDSQLKGRELTSDQLKEHVLTRTPEYRSKEAISILKKGGKVRQLSRDGTLIYSFVPLAGAQEKLFE